MSGSATSDKVNAPSAEPAMLVGVVGDPGPGHEIADLEGGVVGQGQGPPTAVGNSVGVDRVTSRVKAY